MVATGQSVVAARGKAIAGTLFLAMVSFSPLAVFGKTVGIVYPDSSGFYDTATEAFKKRLAEGGFDPGNAEIFVQKPSPDPMSRSNALRKFIGVDADLIVVYGDRLLQAVCRENTKIPVAYGFVFDPKSASCARSDDKPGGNARGVISKPPLHTLLSKARLMTDFKTVGVMTFPDDATSEPIISELRSRGVEIGYNLIAISVSKPVDAVAALRDAPALGLFVLPIFSLDPARIQEVLALTIQKRIPTISLTPTWGEKAPLLSLYFSPEEQGQLLGDLAIPILKGEKSQTALLTPKKIVLEINLPLAKQIDVKVPMSLLEDATQVLK